MDGRGIVGAAGAAHRLVGLLAVLALAPACIFQVRTETRDPVAEALDACERAYSPTDNEDGARAATDAAVQCLLDADVAWPGETRVHADLARLYTLRAVAWPSSEATDLYTARSWGLRCLALRSGTAGRLEGTGGRVSPRVLQVVPVDDTVCLVWGAQAWARWLARHGAAGAGIDLEAVEGMARRAIELDPVLERGRPGATLGLALAVVPAPLGPRRDEAAEHLRQARRAAPDRLLAAVDMAEFVYAPRGEEDAWRRTLEAVASTDVEGRGWKALENLAARRRATRLLDAGFPEVEAWDPVGVPSR